MKYGKTIKLFLIDGEPNGRMTCELSNWTGKAYKIPRIKVKECGDRDDLTNTGVYLLFGKDEMSKDAVYIGEAESVYKRLTQHLSQKDFWNETIVFVSKDENLNKAHVKYIENRLFEIAKSINRYNVVNTTTPTQSSIAESDRAEMEEFIDNIRVLVNTLGHRVFEVVRDVNTTNKQIFHINAAKGEQTNDGFVVFAGSKFANSIVPSMTSNFIRIRDELISSGALLLKGEELYLEKDYVFSSPSTAAAMVMGRNANGLTEWKLKDGTNLKEFEASKS